MIGFVDQPLRVMTWNLWWRFGPWQARQAAILRTIQEANPDIVFLQEVWAETDGVNQVESLAATLGYEFTFASAAKIDGVELGNAILSRWPLTASGSIVLPRSEMVDEDRRAVCAVVATPSGAVPCISTHLTWQRNDSVGRQAQVKALLELADGLAQSEWPVVIGGDFNADPDSDEIRMITGKSSAANSHMVLQDAWLQAGNDSSGVTWTPKSQHFQASRETGGVAMPWLARRLDYIFVGLPDGRPHDTAAVQVEKCWLNGVGSTIDDEGSDHYAVVAELRPHRLS